MTARILIIGRTGQVATELRALLPDAVALEAPELDLTRADSIAAALAAHRPAVVVNAAAYTAVDRAEDERDLAFAVNADGPALLGAATAAAGIPVLHISTDYVFDGTRGTPYVETDATSPLGVYGASKLEGERRLRDANPRTTILRTAWVCSAHGGNFVKTMLRLAAERPALRVVADQHGAPTFAADLADALAAIALGMIADDKAPTGLFHFTNAGVTTWKDFAAAIFAAAAERGLKTPRLEAITTADYPTPARRPAYSALSTRRIEEAYGVRPRPWAEGLGRLIDDSLETAQ